jgi:hypothetical protein
MGLCDRVHVIIATQVCDSFNVVIDSECNEIEEFVQDLGPLSMDDLTDLSKSKVIDMMRMNRCCPGCLVPSGIINVASLEAGLISRTRAQHSGRSTIEFSLEDND